MEFLSAPPLGSGSQDMGAEDSELQIVFHASQSVPAADGGLSDPRLANGAA